MGKLILSPLTERLSLPFIAVLLPGLLFSILFHFPFYHVPTLLDTIWPLLSLTFLRALITSKTLFLGLLPSR